MYLMLTSIKPHQRMRVENMIVAALWYGPNLPDMDIALQPVLKVISELNRDGVSVQKAQSTVFLRPKLLCAVFDLPGRSKATKTKQFNGEYGYFYCYDKGEVLHGARIYKPEAEHKLQNSTEMIKWAEIADKTGEVHYGVKGKAILAQHIEFPQCILPDYMHSVLEGIFKQLMKFWFDSKFHNQLFSLRKFMSQINNLLLKVTPISEIQRRPQSLESISFYKASEYKAWLIFYVFPILSQFLPLEYTHHLSLLVSSMHILLSDEIRVSELATVHNMLCTFYQAGGDLYTMSIYTANMHSLQHMVPLVKLWGPLWCYSMFGFENVNGIIGTTFHDTRKIIHQMCFNIQLRQTLPLKLQELKEGESFETRQYLDKILSKAKSNMSEIGPHCYAVGKLSPYHLTNEEQRVVALSGIALSSSLVQKFERLFVNGITFHSDEYVRSATANNKICSFQSDGTLGYGKIKSMYLSQDSEPFSLIQKYSIKENSYITTLRPCRNKYVRQLDTTHGLSKQLVEVEPSGDVVAILLKQIVKKCFIVTLSINRRNITYLIQLPNTYEVH